MDAGLTRSLSVNYFLDPGLALQACAAGMWMIGVGKYQLSQSAVP